MKYAVARGQQPEVNLFRNSLLLQNLVRTPDHRVVHCWGQRSRRGQSGQPEVISLRVTAFV